MGRYILRRLLVLIPTLIMITVVGFVIMELPPNDFVSQYVMKQAANGNTGLYDQQDALRHQYGLDQPEPVQFLNWVANFAHGDFGRSFVDLRPVADIIGERLPATIIISLFTFLVSWGIGIPLGVYSATHQYSKVDHLLTTIAFVGIGIPDFLLAIIIVVVTWMATGDVLMGLNSPDFISAPWSLAKIADFASHAWLSVTAVAFTGTAFIMRVMRNNMLEELGKNYVVTLRAKGLRESKVIWKHVFRNALHPLIMLFGQVLVFLINGFTITSVILNLPTIQTVYLQATLQQDIYLGGAILVLIAILVMVGNLVSDVLLAWLDPRVRYD
jgi:peptide/nickel transport system permease protein